MRRLHLQTRDLVRFESDEDQDAFDLPEELVAPKVVAIRKSKTIAADGSGKAVPFKITIPNVRFYDSDEELDGHIASGATDLDPQQLNDLFYRKAQQLRRYGQQFARRHDRPPTKQEKRAFGLFKDFYRALGNDAVQPYAQKHFEAVAGGMTTALLPMAIRALRARGCRPDVATIVLPILYQKGPARLMLGEEQILNTLDCLLRGPESDQNGLIVRKPDQLSYAALKALPAVALSLYVRAAEIKGLARATPGLLLWQLEQFIPANDQPQDKLSADPFAAAAQRAFQNTRSQMSPALAGARLLHAKLEEDRRRLRARYRSGLRRYAAMPGTPEHKLQTDWDRRRGHLIDLRAHVEDAFTPQGPSAGVKVPKRPVAHRQRRHHKPGPR